MVLGRDGLVVVGGGGEGAGLKVRQSLVVRVQGRGDAEGVRVRGGGIRPRPTLGVVAVEAAALAASDATDDGIVLGLVGRIVLASEASRDSKLLPIPGH